MAQGERPNGQGFCVRPRHRSRRAQGWPRDEDKETPCACHSLTHRLGVDVGFADVNAGLRLLSDGLGFHVSSTHRDASGWFQYSEARWPDGGGVVFGSRGRLGAWGALGPQGVHVVAAEASTVDAAWPRVKARDDVEVLQELHDGEYESHEFSVRDRDGHLWTVGTYRGA